MTVATNDPVITGAAAMDAPNARALGDISVQFLADMAEPMTQIASPTHLAPPKRLMAAHVAMDQSKAGKTQKQLVHSQVWALLWPIVKMCSGLTQVAKAPRSQSIQKAIKKPATTWLYP